MDSRSQLKLVLVYGLLLSIVSVALGIRLFRVGKSPSSVNWDEAALGYNAYSILKTGKDEYGAVLPVSLRSFNDYKPAVYAYFVIPWLVKGTLSSVTTRLPSVIFGSLLVLSIFVICLLLSRSHLVAILASLCIAFEPWALHFSRIAFEANVANSIFYLALALFLYSVSTKKFFYQSLILLVLATYTYHSERIIAIPLVIILMLLYRQQRKFVPGAILLAFLYLPLGWNLIHAPIVSRLGSTSLFRLWPFIPSNFSWWIYNPIYTLVWHLSGQFLAYFSPSNLFLRGSTEPGQYIPTLGLLHAIELPAWAVGGWLVWHQKNLRKFLLPIMVFAPVPGLITWNWFSVVRSLSLYPVFAIWIGVGINFFWHRLRFLTIPIAVVWLISVVYLLNTEVLFAPAVTYGEYQPGFDKSVPYIMSLLPSYDHVIIDSPQAAAYIFILFYGHYDPQLYQSQTAKLIKTSGDDSLPFGKFEFRKIYWPTDKHLHNTLFMGTIFAVPDSDPVPNIQMQDVADIYDIKGYISYRIAGVK